MRVWTRMSCLLITLATPAKLWNSWSGGWAGLAAHAGTGVLFQVQDGYAIRAYDILGEKLLWETTQTHAQNVLKEQDAEKRKRGFEQGILYMDRRFDVAKDGKVVRTGHDGGSGLDTWIEGYDLPAK